MLFEDEGFQFAVDIGKPKVHDCKGGTEKFISFAVLLRFPGGNNLKILGFRIYAKRIVPPSIRLKSNWLDTIQCGSSLADHLYTVVEDQQITNKVWGDALEETGGLLPREEATKTLLYDTEKTKMLFDIK